MSTKKKDGATSGMSLAIMLFRLEEIWPTVASTVRLRPKRHHYRSRVSAGAPDSAECESKGGSSAQSLRSRKLLRKRADRPARKLRGLPANRKSRPPTIARVEARRRISPPLRPKSRPKRESLQDICLGESAAFGQTESLNSSAALISSVRASGQSEKIAADSRPVKYGLRRAATDRAGIAREGEGAIQSAERNARGAIAPSVTPIPTAKMAIAPICSMNAKNIVALEAPSDFRMAMTFVFDAIYDRTAEATPTPPTASPAMPIRMRKCAYALGRSAVLRGDPLRRSRHLAPESRKQASSLRRNCFEVCVLSPAAACISRKTARPAAAGPGILQSLRAHDHARPQSEFARCRIRKLFQYCREAKLPQAEAEAVSRHYSKPFGKSPIA